MPERVITKVIEADPKSNMRSVLYRLGDRYTRPGEEYDPNTRRYNGPPVWWQGSFFVQGAETGKLYFGRPGNFYRRGEEYNRGVLLQLCASLNGNGLAATSLGPVVPPLEVGRFWMPIAEKIGEIIAQNDLEFSPVNGPVNPNVFGLPITSMFTIMDDLATKENGGIWGLSTKAMNNILLDGQVTREAINGS
jgi:hypothetical protein